MMKIFGSEKHNESVPLVENIKAGFPNPAQDFVESSLDLNRYVIRNPASTFYARIDGNSMKDAGIADGDIVVIDKSLEPAEGRIAVCYLDGEFTLKRLQVRRDGIWLIPENPDYKPIRVTEDNHFVIWGIVTYVIKKM